MEAEVGLGPPLIVTVWMEAAGQAYFDGLRTRYYPAGLNVISAHLTLFHKLPQEDWVLRAVRSVAAGRDGFGMRVVGVRSLGRGVAFGLEAAELMGVRRELAEVFEGVLTAQDRQKFWPHVVVQNKVSGAEAKQVLGELAAGFLGFEVRALGLEVWEYLGGPWRLVERVEFGQGGQGVFTPG